MSLSTDVTPDRTASTYRIERQPGRLQRETATTMPDTNATIAANPAGATGCFRGAGVTQLPRTAAR